MKAFINKLFQSVAVASTVATNFSGFVPPKAQAPLTIGISVAQAVVGALAHYYTPNGDRIKE